MREIPRNQLLRHVRQRVIGQEIEARYSGEIGRTEGSGVGKRTEF
jgi:hypothetical protein